MYFLPEKIKNVDKKSEIGKNLSFFYITLFLISGLFLTTFYLNIHLSKPKVLGIKSNTSREFMFWNMFTQENPQYYQGWIELYNLTGEKEYLNKAFKIDPNK